VILIVVTCSPYRHRIKLVRRLANAERRAVCGVTTLNDKIFVAYHELPFIVVYVSHEPYTRLPNISVNGLKDPIDIAAGTTSLYMSDWGSMAIWRIKVGLANSKVDKWLSGVMTLSVSVTSEKKVALLVMVNMKGSERKCRFNYSGEIHVYSAGAVKETVIKLSPDITFPHCVVMTTRKTFIVSYGFDWHEMNRVFEVDMNGHMLKAFGSAPGEGVGELNTPFHVSLDEEERVIVADSGNDRVLLLDSRLMLQRVLVTWHPQWFSDDAGSQSRLHYDRHSGKLLVGSGSGNLDVYQLRA